MARHPNGGPKTETVAASPIELRRISDGVLQTFMDRVEYCVRAHFPVVVPVVSSKVRPDIAFAIPAVLQNNDGSRKRIRRERRSGVSNTPGNTQQQLTRNNVLEVDLAGRLGVCDVLLLPGFLLNKFIGNQEANDIVRNGQA